MKKNLLFFLLIVLITCNTQIVFAGRGCCSKHNGVDKTKCTTDGRQVCNGFDDDGREVISNGDGCKCNPEDYDDSSLIVPEGHPETNPYGYSYGSKSYNNINNNSSTKDYSNVIALLATIGGGYGAYNIFNNIRKKK